MDPVEEFATIHHQIRALQDREAVLREQMRSTTPRKPSFEPNLSEQRRRIFQSQEDDALHEDMDLGPEPPSFVPTIRRLRGMAADLTGTVAFVK